ncbi:MAG TPA: NAD-dependent epimerase/dehydratase family protein [Chitinophagaceae bacterium]|jgi:hypothetical protein|nr:NAD-dependent epimerase/dehydratase family protein [Chitinophagaceae bacterium]
MKSKTIITGSTGMVGEGVLLECLENEAVEQILVINRRPCGYTHPKLKEIIHKDFFNLAPIENELKGYDACFFCLGVSSVGMKKEDYYHFTYELTMHAATRMARQNPSMIFCYVSGRGTRSSEEGGMNWARVKGKTENDLAKVFSKRMFAFRPAILKATKGQKHLLSAYKYFGWLYGFFKFFSRNAGSTLKELGLAMINVVTKGYDKNVIEVKDILILSKK